MNSGQQLFDTFEAWYQSRVPSLQEKGYTVEFVRSTNQPEDASSQTYKTSVHLDILSRHYAARITLWDSGESDFEVLDYETGSPHYFVHSVFHDPQEMNLNLNKLLRRFFD
jgi:hypothetical protein